MGNKITLNKAINKTLDFVEGGAKIGVKVGSKIIDTGLEVMEKGAIKTAEFAKECRNKRKLNSGRRPNPVNYPKADEVEEEEQTEEDIAETSVEPKFTLQEIDDIMPALEKLNNIYSKT